MNAKILNTLLETDWILKIQVSYNCYTVIHYFLILLSETREWLKKDSLSVLHDCCSYLQNIGIVRGESNDNFYVNYEWLDVIATTYHVQYGRQLFNDVCVMSRAKSLWRTFPAPCWMDVGKN